VSVYRVMLCIVWTMLWQYVCLSVCLSHPDVVSKLIVRLFLLSGRHTVLVFPQSTENVMAIFKEHYFMIKTKGHIECLV